MILYNKNKTQLTEDRNNRVNHVLNHRQNDLTIILENVNDPHNIAAVLRTCDAVGIMEIFVLNTTSNTYKHFDERKSSSANKWMIVHQYENINECFEHDFNRCNFGKDMKTDEELESLRKLLRAKYRKMYYHNFYYIY